MVEGQGLWLMINLPACEGMAEIGVAYPLTGGVWLSVYVPTCGYG